MAPRLASRSQQLYRRARDLIPGGVNSPVRAYPPYPLFVSSARGSRFRTVDGEEYLDYCMGYGALLDGHAYSETLDAVKAAIDKGTIFGQPTEMPPQAQAPPYWEYLAAQEYPETLQRTRWWLDTMMRRLPRRFSKIMGRISRL